MSFRSGNNRFPRGQLAVFGLLLTLSVGMMGGSGTRFARTLQTTVNLLVNPVEIALNGVTDTLASTAGAYWSTLTQVDSLRKENERLSQENAKLQEELGRAPDIAHLWDDWTRITQAASDTQYHTTIGRVVLRDISDVRRRTLIIDKGLADGVGLGQVAMDDGGALVGRVDKVEQYNAEILLVNDTSAVVVGLEADTGATGTIHGEIDGQLSMSYVNSNDQLTKGAPVVTAGMVLPGTGVDSPEVRSPYPRGLLIGTITQLAKDPNQVVQSAVVKPAADLNNIEFVLIITNYQGGFASPAPLDTSNPSPNPSAEGSPNPSPIPNPTPVPTPIVPPEPTPPRPTPSPPPGLITPPPH
jgi:rod shape-determining protein MreC